MTPEQIKNLDRLLPEEREEMWGLYDAWQEARKHKDWERADKLRARYYWWDTTLGGDCWYPVFEWNLNRQRRAFKRMAKYGIDIYPWTKL